MSAARDWAAWSYATESCSISIPDESVSWKEIVAAAQETRERLKAQKLKSFVKLSGGKGIHVVVPVTGADWDSDEKIHRAHRRGDDGGFARSAISRK